jgi:DNA (cytosine-5)-methyltransferase 1
MNEHHHVLDLFAGTGVGVAIKRLGAQEFGVEKMPEAIATREANGMTTIYEDVWDAHFFELRAQAWRQWTLWGSPPCPSFSSAGNGSGRKQMPLILQAIEDGVWKDIDELRAWSDSLEDVRSGLTLVPMHYVSRFKPTYVALEQVPGVLPIWEAYAVQLRMLGYSVWTGYLYSEQYGVPQTRKRAFLMARRDGHQAVPPVPTHSKYHSHDKGKLDSGVKKWVSMGEALDGWNDDGLYAAGRTAVNTSGQVQRPMTSPAPTVTGATVGQGVRLWPTDRPAPTVTGGGAMTGGWEPFGTGGRRAIRASLSSAITAAAETPMPAANA